MKHLTSLFGIALVVIGIVLLSYQGFQYTKHEQIAKIGDVEVSVNTPRRVDFPPLLGGVSIAGGIVILVIGRIRKK